MPWSVITWRASVGDSVAQLLQLGRAVSLPCYLDEIRSWSTAIAGSSEPTITVHWLLDDVIPTDFLDPRIVPPWGFQAQSPVTRSPSNNPDGSIIPICAWAPEGTRRLLYVYEGGGIPANDFELSARIWEA